MTTKASTTRKRRTASAVASKATKSLAKLEIQNLPIGKIKPDSKQPRKTFDETQLVQLSDSIKEHGVLQPITVRQLNGHYVIVMGERRYRASKLAKKKTIPCIVRDFQNEEVLEVQIIENLQRQDVEPTEEADAIAYLSKKYSSTEIAKRLGRTDNFVRQRIKLSSLIDGFKHFVRNGEMTISLGVTVALFEPAEQQMMLETLEGNFNVNKINRMVRDQTYDLENAPFDIHNKKLLPKADACLTCPFNASNQGNLFGEGKMICTKSVCFETKKSKALLNLIEKSKKDNTLLIPEFYSYWLEDDNNQALVSLLESKGFEIYLLNNVEVIENPIKPTAELLLMEYNRYNYSDIDLEEDLKAALITYEEKLEKYKSAQANGYKKAIMINPHSYLTRDIFVKIIEESDKKQSSNSVPLANKKMNDCTPEEQIQKINEREIRKKQIENNKQFEEVVDMIRETDYINTKKGLTKDEMVAFSISLLENNVDYLNCGKYFANLFKYNAKLSKVEMVEDFKKNFKKEVFNKLIRYILTQQVHFGESNHVNNLTNISFYTAMQGYYKSKIASIEKEYAEKRTKRETRLQERITVLEKKIKALGN